MTQHTSIRKKLFLSLIALFTIIIIVYGTTIYLKIFRNNVNTSNTQEYLYIPTGSTFDDVVEQLKKDKLLKDVPSFVWVAEKMNYKKIKPGKYKIKAGTSNLNLIKMLRSGNQEPVKFTFQNIRLKSDFVKFVGRNLETDSTQLLNLLDDSDFLRTYGFTPENVYCMFIPNTYQFFWNTSAETFFKRMYQEYEKFWTKERNDKAKEIGLNPIEVSILAAIVDQEALLNDEMNTIAGVYINRLQKNMKLEADPTVIFANGDFTVNRVLNYLLEKDSPYNTYLYGGLPPGPIAMPSIAAIDAVLNYQKHNYIFFCAKEDLSGYHNFAETYADHKENARKFQKALNERNIRR